MLFVRAIFAKAYTVSAGCPIGDLDAYCVVNFEDVEAIAQQRLCSTETVADLNWDDWVDLIHPYVAGRQLT